MTRLPCSLVACALAVLALTGCTSIPEGRSAIDSVRVIGAHTLDADAVADKLATTASPRFLGLMRGVVLDYEIFDASMLQRDLARLERYYQGHGFLDAHARAGRVVRLSADHVRVEVVVDEGPATLVRAVRVDGLQGVPAPIADAVRAGATDALPAKARFDEDAYAKAKTQILRALTDRGYAYATVQADAQMDLAGRTVDYVFTVHAGIPAVLGPITIVDAHEPEANKAEPNKKSSFDKPLDEAPLRRAMHLQQGEPYSTAELDTATQALLDLGVLASAHLVPDLKDPTRSEVPLEVTIEPAKLHAIRFGGGLEFDSIKTELHGRVGYEDHDFYGDLRNFSWDFTPGVVLYPLRFDNIVTPQHLLAEERTRVQLRQPGFLEPRTTGFVRPEINVFPMLVSPNPNVLDPVSGYIEPKTAFGLERRLLKHLTSTASINVQGEVPFFYPVGVDTKNTPLPPAIAMIYPELVTTLDYRDNALHPHKGFFLTNDVSVAWPGSAHDVRVQPDARAYVPLGKRVTLAGRGSVGLLFPFNYGEYVQQLKDVDSRNQELLGSIQPNPLSPGLPGDPGSQALDHVVDRDIEIVYFRGFFLGGPDSNRGYPIRGIAPHGVIPFLSPSNASALLAANCVPGTPTYNAANCQLPIGGFTLWQASLEVRFDVAGPFGVATFCDAGDVSSTPFPQKDAFRFTHLHLSCGVGMRYDTPVGPIRLDIGYRVQPLQVLGYANETAAQAADKTETVQPLFLNQPLALSFGIGEAF